MPSALGENFVVKSGTYIYSLGGQDGTMRNFNYRFPLCPATISASSTRICIGASVVLTSSTLSNYSWTPGGATSQSITVSPNTTTTYTVTGLNATYNCTASVSQVITVDPLTVAGTASSNQTIQPGATPSNLSLTGNVGAIQWQSSSDNSTWTDISAATATTLTGAQMGGSLSSTKYFRAKVTSGVCSDEYSNTITITVGNPCTNAGTLSGTQAFCVGSTSQLSSTVTGGTWSTDNSLVASVNASTGLVTGVAAGTAVISYSVTNGCSVPTREVTVTAASSAGTLSGTQEICVSGTTTFTSSAPQVQLDRGLHFVGGTLAANSDYVTVNSSFPVSTGDFTIEVWVKPGLIDNQYHGFFGSQLDGVGRDQSMWVGPNGSLHTDFNRGGTRYDMLTGDNFFTTNTWTHVAWVKEGTTFKLYKNGELVTSRVAPANATPGNGFYWLGRVDNFFTGALDEFRIWNVARTPSQIQLNMNQQISTQTNLVTYYDFNQGTANGTNTGVTTLTDRTTSALNGSLTGFALTGTTSNWIGGVDVNGTWTSSDASIATVHPITGLVTG